MAVSTPVVTAIRRVPVHTLLPAMASSVGAPMRLTLAVTRSVRGSIREMVPESWSATQTDLGPATSAAGPRPTRIVAVTAEVARSIRETVASGAAGHP